VVQSENWDVGLAPDGDADRIGAVRSSGRFVDPHCIFSLALRYLVEQRGWQGAVVKTVSTTQMVNRLAKRYGLELYETPVGFNHICDYMLNNDILIGGEESGGITIKGHIPEGDGILMGLLLLEIMAASGRSLDELWADLMADVGPVYYSRHDYRIEGGFSKLALVAQLTAHPPDRLAGLAIREVSDRDGVKYWLEDDSWLLIRPSGTEPVLRVYAEAPTPELVNELLAFGGKVAGVRD